MESIVIALISGLCVAIPSVFATRKSNDKTSALTQYQIQELTKKVEKHNNVIERMALAEQAIKSIWKNIDEIKK